MLKWGSLKNCLVEEKRKTGKKGSVRAVSNFRNPRNMPTTTCGIRWNINNRVWIGSIGSFPGETRSWSLTFSSPTQTGQTDQTAAVRREASWRNAAFGAAICACCSNTARNLWSQSEMFPPPRCSSSQCHRPFTRYVKLLISPSPSLKPSTMILLNPQTRTQARQLVRQKPVFIAPKSIFAMSPFSELLSSGEKWPR